jgi:hypothetical protein
MKHVRFLIGNSLILAVFSASLGLAASKDPLVIGPVRADGLIVPVAMWEDSAWVELTLEHIGPLGLDLPWEWHYVGANRERRIINRSNPVKVIEDFMGDDTWGTMTDFSLPPEASDSWPVPTTRTVGFASSREITVVPFHKLGRGDVQWDEVTTLIKAKLDSAATVELPRLETHSWFRSGVRDTMTVECSIASLPRGDSFVGYAFTTLELGESSRDPGCAWGVSFSGWLIGDRGLVAPAHWRVWQDDCDFKLAEGEQPIAVFEHDDRLFILSTAWAYEGSLRKLLEYAGGELINVKIRER